MALRSPVMIWRFTTRRRSVVGERELIRAMKAMGKVPENENEETLRAFPAVVLLGQLTLLEVHEDIRMIT